MNRVQHSSFLWTLIHADFVCCTRPLLAKRKNSLLCWLLFSALETTAIFHIQSKVGTRLTDRELHRALLPDWLIILINFSN